MAETSSEPLFPILKGESVGASGEFNGRAVLVCTPEDLNRDWSPEEIPVLKDDLAEHFKQSPGDLDELLSKVSAVISEFGESIGNAAALAFVRDIIFIAKVPDACFVMETDMRIRVTAHENKGNIFFIE